MSRLGVHVVLALAFILLLPFRAGAAESYTLGPGDRVQVRVFDFRSGGAASQWAGFDGSADYIVGPNGHLSLPIVGDFDAQGKTTVELEEAVATKLQTRAGLISKPYASVQIVRFRPFYVVGAVEKPGEYEYPPGLTVLQAFGMAGGPQRANTDQMIGLEKDALTSRGDLRVLSVDRTSLLASKARLDAEVAGRQELDFPEELRKAAARNADVARILREEQLLFDSERTGLDKQVSGLEQTKSYLLNEVETLKQKAVTIEKGLDAMRKEREIVAGLLSKGLTAAPRQLELDQNIAQVEGNQLDVQVAIVRANEDIAKADRDISDLKSNFVKNAIKDAAGVRDKLADTAEKMETSRSLVEEAEFRAPNMTLPNVASYARPTYVLSRRGRDGKMEELSASDSDAVQPGDVLRVIPQNAQRPSAGILGDAH